MPTLTLFLNLLPGIVAAERLDPSPAIPLAAALAALAVYLAAPRRGAWAGAAARAALLLIPPLIAASRIAVTGAAPDVDLPAEGVVIEGRVAGRPAGSVATLEATGGPLRGFRLPWERPRGGETPAPGSEVAVRGDLRPLPFRRNDGGWDRYARWRKRGSAGLLVGAAVAREPGRSAAARLRRSFEERIARIGGEEAALLRALFLGSKEDVSRERVIAFRSAGLSHLLALSGLHLGILYGVIAAPLFSLPVPRRFVPLLAVAALWFYGAAAAFPVSLLRALTMASFLAFGRMMRWSVRPLNALGAAALVAIALDPRAAAEISFQLSFAATAGILACRPLLERLGGSPLGRFVAAPLVVSLAAQIATLPFLVYHFQQVAPLAALATLLVSPLTAFALVTGTLHLTAGACLPLLDRTFEAGAWAALRLLGAAVDFVARHGPPPLVVCRPRTAVAAIPAVAALIALVSLRRGEPRLLAAIVPAAALLAVLPGLGRAFGPPGALPLRVTFIDVGQGSATLIETGSGESILVDAGYRSETWDNGAAVIAPLLRRRGAWPLNLAFVSHPDADHLGGMVSLVRGGGVRRLFDPGLDHPSALYGSYVDAATDAPCRWAACRAGTEFRFADGTSVRVLYAPEGRAPPDRPNDASLILLVRRGRFSMLLPGDAPPELERFLAAHRLADRLTLLNAPHHGAGTGCTDRLLRLARPRIAVISAGEGNRYGHPHPGALRRLARRGAAIYRTDRHGAITLRTDGRRLRVEASSPARPPREIELPPAPRRARGTGGFW